MIAGSLETRNQPNCAPEGGNHDPDCQCQLLLESSKYVQVDNLAETGGAFLVNARLGLKLEKFNVSVFGRNLTNEVSIPLATRWSDLRYGAGTQGLPAVASVTFDGRPAQIETGTPRGLFGALRRGRTFGMEGTFNF